MINKIIFFFSITMIIFMYIPLQIIYSYEFGSDSQNQYKAYNDSVHLTSNLDFIAYENKTSKDDHTNTIILYPPEMGENLFKNEKIVLHGYIDTQIDLPGSIVNLYETNNNSEKCLVSTYKIEDSISTHFSFEFSIRQVLLKCDHDITKNKELEFVAISNSNYSNTIIAKVYPSERDLPVPRQQFIPDSYNIPIKAKAVILSDSMNISSFAYLDEYHLSDKYADNLERYYPKESLHPEEYEYPISINQTRNESLLVLSFNTDLSKTNEPLFLNVFLNQSNATKNILGQDIFSLYELKQIDQHPWKYSIPLVFIGSYDFVLRAYFGEVIGEYAIHDLIIT